MSTSGRGGARVPEAAIGQFGVPEARIPYLHVVASINEIVVHVLVVCVRMVAVPVEDVVPDV